MGKSSKYPSYSGGSVKVNGNTIATTTQNGNTVNSSYNMSDLEKQIYDYAQNSFWQALPNVNVFDENTQKNIQNQLTAYTNQGKKLINEMYTPMLDNLKTDIASRFGNFDNSSFMNGLNKIEDKRADSMSDLSQDILSKQNELYTNELANRYQYLGFMNDIQNQINNNIWNYINGSVSNSTNGNNYNARTYAANNSGSNWGQYANLASGALASMGPYGMAAAGALQVGKQFL